MNNYKDNIKAYSEIIDMLQEFISFKCNSEVEKKMYLNMIRREILSLINVICEFSCIKTDEYKKYTSDLLQSMSLGYREALSDINDILWSIYDYLKKEIGEK